MQFITFNYTSNLLKDYCNIVNNSIPIKKANQDYIVLKTDMKSEIIHIHGDLKNNSNDIIFGYGDDNSKKYKELKDLEKDNLLENFKTFHYLKNDKYKQILNLLDSSDKIKVVSIGHSLSLCDKTLLKTIFTHNKISEIEVAYHDSEKEYFKNIYNLARIIDDNLLMREKVVPLSQTLKIIPNKK